MLLDSSLRSILRKTCNGILRGKLLLPLKEESSSLSGLAMRRQRLVLIAIWLFAVLKDVAFLCFLMVQKIEMFTLKVLRIINFQQPMKLPNSNLRAKENKDYEEDDYEIGHGAEAENSLSNDSSDDSSV